MESNDFQLENIAYNIAEASVKNHFISGIEDESENIENSEEDDEEDEDEVEDEEECDESMATDATDEPQKSLVYFRESYGEQGESALEATEPLEIWSLFFTQEMLHILLYNTNAQIELRRAQTKRLGVTHDFIDIEELKAIFGLLYFSGINNANFVNSRRLWSPAGLALFRATCSEHRFAFLLENIQFGPQVTKEQKSQDKFAELREIWEMFIDNCRKYYTGTNYNVSNLLLGFKGSCPFRITTSHNIRGAERCGMRLKIFNDVKTSYLIQAIPYLGEIKGNKDSINPSINVKQESGCIIKDCIISKKDYSKSFYRTAKSYSTRRKTRKWTMRYFYTMLDLAGINAHVKYNENTCNEKLTRELFLEKLSLQLVKPYLMDKMDKPGMQKKLKNVIEMIFPTEFTEAQDPLQQSLFSDKLDKRKRCKICPSPSNRKTNVKCVNCSIPVCSQHLYKICDPCLRKLKM